jgi:hypothetical protein
MNRSRFHIAAMDCPSEEQLIRRALGSFADIERMEFDLPARSLLIWHREEAEPIQECLKRLDLGAELAVTEDVPASEA